MVAFGSYIWLLRVSSPARVSTYAFVNPAVALLIGAWLGKELLTPKILVAASVMIAGVAMIVTSGSPVRPSPRSRVDTTEKGLAAEECP
jgi:drug/metabolite transporter (DMT)-like permease